LDNSEIFVIPLDCCIFNINLAFVCNRLKNKHLYYNMQLLYIIYLLIYQHYINSETLVSNITIYHSAKRKNSHVDIPA